MQDKKYNEMLSIYFALDADSPSGLVWIAKYGIKGSNVKIGDVVGSRDKKDGYWRIHALGSHYKAHKVVWAMNNGYASQEGMVVDHFDGNPSNNAIGNLRLTTGTVNQHNRQRGKSNTTGQSGVAYSERVQPTGKFFSKYTSTVYIDGVKTNKSFSIQKYGDEAFKEAVAWRSATIALLNKRGAGYTERHGK